MDEIQAYMKKVKYKYFQRSQMKKGEIQVFSTTSNEQKFQLTGASSVPRVFIGGRCIGGGDETAAAHKCSKFLFLTNNS